jgi:hypothetical protein
VLAEHGRTESRCRLLPARLVVYATLLMCLKPTVSYQKLMYQIAAAVPLTQAWPAPNRSAFAQARQRLGWEAMESLFRAQAMPLATPEAACCFWRERRVMAIDGTTIELANRPILWEEFGGQIAKGQRIGAPLSRVVTLTECGTRAVVDAEIASYATSENTLAEHLARSLAPGQLALADRNFLSVRLWKRCLGAGADLLWRVKGTVAVRDRQELGDGSYLAMIDKGKKATQVRVIEYALEGADEVYRLVTNLLDPNMAPAHELARLYAERWEVEIGYREVKATQCAGKPLRSLTPDGARQEVWANFVAYNISRRLVYDAAMRIPDRDPDHISFSLAQDLARLSANRPTGLKATRLAASVRDAIHTLTQPRVLVTRHDRSCPRIARHRRSKFPSRALHQGPLSTHRSRKPQIFTLGPSPSHPHPPPKRPN